MSLATKTGGIIWRLFAQAEERKSVESYLFRKYGLAVTIAHNRALTGGSFGQGGQYYQFDGPWWPTLASLYERISTADEVTDDFRIVCGDFALFLFHGDYQLDAPIRDVFRTLVGTQTYVSLVEMGRGRGDLYALKIIQQELAANSRNYHWWCTSCNARVESFAPPSTEGCAHGSTHWWFWVKGRPKGSTTAD